MKHDQSPLKIASGGAWVSLHPGLQHTAYADLVLSNQFDALIGVAEDGQLQPLGALSWKISPDYKIYEFDVDTAKRFSDGSSLTSYDYKNSWEEALKLSPKSENNSLLDVLYKVVGFEDFEKTGHISGIETPSASKLIVHFKTSFRMTVDHFQGNRFSAFKKIGEEKYIGTGCYVISEQSKEVLQLDPNPFHPQCKNKQQVILNIVKHADAISSLRKGEIDVFAYGFSTLFESLNEEPNIKVVSGHENGHDIFILNGIKGRFFENPHHRLAMQYLLLKNFNEIETPLKNPHLLRLDPQVYLPFQKGRLDEKKALEIIASGEKYVPELIAASKKHPILVYTFEPRAWVLELVKKTGVTLAAESKVIPRTELLNIYYKTHEPDILPFGFSIVGSDPDGIYHALGKSGAIASSMIFREKVAKLLEEGREITQQAELDGKYKEVSTAVLEDVPFVHLGFAKSVVLFRDDKVSLDRDFVRRNFGHLDIYEKK